MLDEYTHTHTHTHPTLVTRISRQPFPVQITTDQTQLKNVEYFKCLGSIITHNARCTRKVKSRTAMAKEAFDKKNLFISKFDLKFREETSEVLHLEHSCVWC